MSRRFLLGYSEAAFVLRLRGRALICSRTDVFKHDVCCVCAARSHSEVLAEISRAGGERVALHHLRYSGGREVRNMPGRGGLQHGGCQFRDAPVTRVCLLCICALSNSRKGS